MDQRLRQPGAAVLAVQFGAQRRQQRLLVRGQAGGRRIQQRPGGRDLPGGAALVDQVMPAAAVPDVITGQGMQAAEQPAQPAERPPAARLPGCP